MRSPVLAIVLVCLCFGHTTGLHVLSKKSSSVLHADAQVQEANSIAAQTQTLVDPFFAAFGQTPLGVQTIADVPCVYVYDCVNPATGAVVRVYAGQSQQAGCLTRQHQHRSTGFYDATVRRVNAGERSHSCEEWNANAAAHEVH